MPSPLAVGESDRWRRERNDRTRLAGIDEKELAAARELGKRIAEVAAANKRGLAQAQ
jgi:hypothetical protein